MRQQHYFVSCPVNLHSVLLRQAGFTVSSKRRREQDPRRRDHRSGVRWWRWLARSWAGGPLHCPATVTRTVRDRVTRTVPNRVTVTRWITRMVTEHGHAGLLILSPPDKHAGDLTPGGQHVAVVGALDS